MRVRWTTDAADDLERICDYIAQTNPDSARRIARTIVDGIASLHTFPNRGRLGRVEGTREVVFAPLPFVAVYEVPVGFAVGSAIVYAGLRDGSDA